MGLLDASFKQMRKEQDKEREHKSEEGLKRSAVKSIDRSVTEEIPMETNYSPRVLLVDDDPVFCRVMQAVAKSSGTDMVICRNVEELGAYSNEPWDVAIIDYDLEIINGLELIKYLEGNQRNLPVLLISQTERIDGGNWSDAIRSFLSKELGPKAIINEALKFCLEKKD